MYGTYDPDEDAYLRSPGLKPFKPRATPSPSPPPIVSQTIYPVRAQSVSSPSSRRRNKSNRRQKTRPSQGDWVLIREMDPNRPDIAQQASERALNSESGSDDEDEMDDRSPTAGQTHVQPAPSDVSLIELQHTAQEGLEIQLVDDAISPNHLLHHRDSGVDAGDVKRSIVAVDRRASHASSACSVPIGIRIDAARTGSTTLAGSPPSTLPAASSSQPGQRHGSIANGYTHDDLSTNLRQLTIPFSRGPESDKLPALQTAPSPLREGNAASPNQQPLPPFQHLDNIARSSAISDQEAHRTTEYYHRQSVSSMSHSPTTITRQLSISSISPNTSSSFSAFPAALSPVSASSDTQKRDVFLTSGHHFTLFGPGNRRSSQASDIHSGSSPSDSYHSPEGVSPGALQNSGDNRPRHMSMDGALSRHLPPPQRSSMSNFGSQPGNFVCKYSGCTAAPFQTQYLLKCVLGLSQPRSHR